MSAPRPESEEAEDRYAELFVDAEDNDDDDENDPDFEDEEDPDEDDLVAAMFDEEDDEFHDAEEGDQIEFVVEVEDGGAADVEESPLNAAGQQRLLHLIADRRAGTLSRSQVLEFMRRIRLGHLLASNDDDDDDDDLHWPRSRRRPPLDPNRFPKVPSQKGMELMNSGVFGATDVSSRLSTKKRIARRILDRELGMGSTADRRVNQGAMKQSMIPTTDSEMIINYDDPVYCGQFSDDGNFFYSCVKDFKVRMYDTSNPYNWRHYKTVPFVFGSWTLTDASLSPDNKWLAYSSMQSNVCLAPTDPNDTGDPYTLNLAGENTTTNVGWGRGFSIFSIRFSGDGRELVAGTNANSIVVYDIESRQVLHQIEGHQDHVNAVCFADKSSPNIIYSGSDDATIKVWDRRSMGDRREAGAFVGHVEGLTYLDSKGDGTYLLSNGKDQSMKLWDQRMMYGTAQFQELDPSQHTRYSDFDYRWGRYDDSIWFPHPNDNSLVTFRGHKVLRTLIRCHFSPPGSTDSRYVYSGSYDGKVYIYNLDATIAGIIDVKKTTTNVRALPARWRHFHQHRAFDGWSTCVRDASWHPNAPLIAASSLNGWDQNMGTVTVHSYNEASLDEGEPRMGTGYSDKLRPVSLGFNSDDEEDEDEDEDENGDESEEDEDNVFGF